MESEECGFFNLPKIGNLYYVNTILCFAIFGENSKWPPFLGRENFLKIANSTFLQYPVGQKFRRNRSISHG